MLTFDGSSPPWETLGYLIAGFCLFNFQRAEGVFFAFIYTVENFSQNLVKVSKIISKNFRGASLVLFAFMPSSFLLYSAPPDDRACGVDVPSGILIKIPVQCFGLLGLIPDFEKYGM